MLAYCASLKFSSNQLDHAGSVFEALVEKLKDYIQVRQILLFVVYVTSLKLDCN